MVWLVGVWVVFFIVVFFFVLVIEGGLFGIVDCFEFWYFDVFRKVYIVCLFVLQYFFFLVVIIVVYIWIVVDLFKLSIERFGLGKSFNNNWCDGNVLLCFVCKEDIQVLKIVVVIVLVFVICLLFFQFRWMMLDFGGEI